MRNISEIDLENFLIKLSALMKEHGVVFHPYEEANGGYAGLGIANRLSYMSLEGKETYYNSEDISKLIQEMNEDD